ncbi:hypothetical protein ACP275_09G004600 [Erythranthe tilingii]
MQWAAHGVQNKFFIFSMNNDPAALYEAALSVITCTTFSSPTLSTILSNISNTLSAVLEKEDVSIDSKKTVHLGLLTKKLQIDLLFLSVQPSDMIVHPILLHSSLLTSRKLSISLTSSVKKVSLISW